MRWGSLPMPRLMTERLRSRTLRGQFGRFVIVGVGNTLVSLVVYQLLLALGAWYVVAAPIAYVASLVNGYLFNRSWTFVARDSTRARVLYVGVQAVGAGMTSLLALFFVQVAGTGRVVAFLAAAVPVTLCTFAANRAWTFPTGTS